MPTTNVALRSPQAAGEGLKKAALGLRHTWAAKKDGRMEPRWLSRHIGIVAVLSLGALLVFSACNSSDATETTTTTATGESKNSAREYTDPNQKIEVGVGDKFTIKLESNPTTGYSWSLAAPLDAAILSTAGDSYIADKPQRTGSGGTQLLTFKAVGKGSTEIQLRYSRPWEENVQPAQAETFKVQVS